jgi:hypothetical protein
MALKKDAYETSKLKTGCAVVIYVTKSNRNKTKHIKFTQLYLDGMQVLTY